MNKKKLDKMITIHHIADCDDFWAEDSEIVDSYLQNIEKYDLLSDAEEQEFLTRAIEGDEEGFNKVMCANLRFTVSIANQYQHNRLSQLDILQATMQGLANAIKESASKPQDEKLMQFAIPFMRQAVEKMIADFDERSKDEELVISELIKEVFVKRGIEPEETIRYKCSREEGEDILAELNERCKELYSDEEIERYREKYAEYLHDDTLGELLLYLEGFDVWKEEDEYEFQADQSFYLQYDSSAGTYLCNHEGYPRK